MRHLVFIFFLFQGWFSYGQEFECFPFNPFEPVQQLTKSSFGATIIDIQAVPVAVDIRQPFHFTVELDQAVDSLVIEEFLGSVVSAGAGNTLFLDDGEGNDLVKGDLIYSCRNIMPNEVGRTDIVTTSNGKFDRLKNIVMYENGTTESISIDIAAGIRFMNLDNIEIPEVKVINDSVQVTDYVFNMAFKYDYNGPPFSIAQLNLLGEYAGDIIEDDNHFLFINSANPSPGSPAGSNSSGGNIAQGTGQFVNPNPQNFTKKFPSIINHYLTYNGEAIGIWVHEVNHRHCSFVEELGLSASSVHWGIVEMESNAFGNGNTGFATEIRNIGGDTFDLISTAQQTQFSKLELYLHGQITIDEVDFPIRTLKNTTQISSTRYRGELVEISKEDWLNTLGPRIPEFEDRDKKVTTVVFSKELLSPEELAYFHRGSVAIELTEPFESFRGIEQRPANAYSDNLITYTTKLRFVDEDADGDSFFSDCDDQDPQVSTLNDEMAYNSIDDDCDPFTPDDDLDEDGFLLADDCDDTNPEINPDQIETPYNGVDDDCDEQSLDDDLDQDGFLLAEDCDDDNPNINPDAEDIPNNGIDEDCDGMDAVSATHDLNGTKVQIYPNPVEDLLRVDFRGDLNFSLILYDLKTKKLFESQNQKVIDLSNLPSGTYLLEIKESSTGQGIIETIIKT